MTREESILLWGSNIWCFADGMFGPLIAVFAAHIGGNILAISWAWAIYLIATGLCTIVVGKVADRVGHEWLMLSGYGLTALFTFTYLLVATPTELFLVQAGLGVALALCNPTWSALYDRYSGDGTKDGSTWGIMQGDAHVAAGLAILVGGGFIVSRYSFSALFIVMGSLQVLATIYTARLIVRSSVKTTRAQA